MAETLCRHCLGKAIKSSSRVCIFPFKADKAAVHTKAMMQYLLPIILYNGMKARYLILLRTAQVVLTLDCGGPRMPLRTLIRSTYSRHSRRKCVWPLLFPPLLLYFRVRISIPSSPGFLSSQLRSTSLTFVFDPDMSLRIFGQRLPSLFLAFAPSPLRDLPAYRKDEAFHLLTLTVILPGACCSLTIVASNTVLGDID